MAELLSKTWIRVPVRALTIAILIAPGIEQAALRNWVGANSVLNNRVGQRRMQRLVLVMLTVFVVARPLPALGAGSRSEIFCTLAAKQFAAFVPASPLKDVKPGRCALGSPEKGEVDLYFPTLGTDSLERERIITVAINNKPIDEPEMGDQAFYILNSNIDLQGRRYYVVQHYARKFAQIFSITFKRYQPFAATDFAAERVAIKAFFDQLD